MRALVLAAVFLGSSSLCPLFAQDRSNSFSQDRPNSSSSAQDTANPSVSSQPQTVPVQPERTPQQSEQARQQDEKRAEDVRVRPGWRTEERDSTRTDRMGHNDMAGMMDQMHRDMDRDDRTVGRNWRMRPDDERAGRTEYGRGYYDDDRPRRRVKICIEYEDGEEFCRYRD